MDEESKFLQSFFYHILYYQKVSESININAFYLHTVDRKSRTCVEFLMANVTFEMLRFLVLNEYLLFIEFPVAVPEELVKENSTAVRSAPKPSRHKTSLLLL